MINIKVIASSSAGNAYLVTDGKTSLLLECGIRFADLRQALDFKMSAVDGCLVTHEHGDHAKSVKDVMKAGVECYTSAGTAEALRLSGHRLNIIEAGKQINIGTWSIMPFDTVHDSKEPLGFLLASGGEKVLFATDTAYIKYRFKGLTHIMLECNYHMDIAKERVARGEMARPVKRRLIRSHMNLDNVLAFLAANDLSRVRGIWLLHLSDGNSDEQMFIDRVQKATGLPVYVCAV